MEIIMKHWLSLAAGIFLLAMMLYGHYRGFIRIGVALLSLVVNIACVRLATPYLTSFLMKNTELQQNMAKMIMNTIGLEEQLAGVQLPAQQRMMIEQLKIPFQIKDLLLENNNTEIYRLLGVDTFFDYMGTYLAGIVLNLVASVILFTVIHWLLRLLVRWLNLIARLPLISGFNHIAGAVLGGVQGLLWLWGGCILVNLCSSTSWAAAVFQQIQSSFWLSYLYQNNLIDKIVVSILRSLV